MYIDMVAGGLRERNMTVNVLSFGFKHGIPLEADLVFDVRFLPNPYYIPELRNKTGLDEDVHQFVFQYQATKDFMDKLEDLINFTLPQCVEEEGKTELVIAVGCTGGRHRSVAVASGRACRVHHQARIYGGARSPGYEQKGERGWVKRKEACGCISLGSASRALPPSAASIALSSMLRAASSAIQST